MANTTKAREDWPIGYDTRVSGGSADVRFLAGQVKDQFEELLPLLGHRGVRDDIGQRHVVTLTQLTAQVLRDTYHIHPTVVTCNRA